MTTTTGRQEPNAGELLLERLVPEMQSRSWLQAAAGLLATQHPRLLHYMTDERVADWRFLLPDLPAGSTLCAGGALSPAPILLAASGARVVVHAPPWQAAFLRERARQEGAGSIEVISYPLRSLIEQFEVVASLRSSTSGGTGPRLYPRLRELADRVKPGGYLYLEVQGPSILLPPRLLGLVLRALGFIRPAFYWPKPSFDNCEMLVRLGDRRIQRYYLQKLFFATSARRRALKKTLDIASRLGLFELTLPGYVVVARRRPSTWRNG